MANPFSAQFTQWRATASTFAETTASERTERLRRLYRATYELRGEIGEAGWREIGLDGRAQLIALKNEVDFVCGHLAEWMEREEVEQLPALEGRRGYIYREPKGLVLHLSTWNAPVLISLQPVVSMIAAGNAVVLKPSEVAPHSAKVIRDIITRAKLTDQVAVVLGGAEEAQALLQLPFDHVCYVGNNRVGRLVMEAAAKHFAGVTLEMGGKNPVIVEAEMDLADTAARLVAGKMTLGGQACLCPDYVLVERPALQDLLQHVTAHIRSFYDPHGRGLAASPDLPRIINEQHTRRVQALLHDAIAKGATLEIGGGVDVSERLVEPTVLTGTTPEMDIYHEEIFGPILTIDAFDSRATAVSQIEQRPKPLGLYVFSSDPEVVTWYIAHTRAGTSSINSLITQATVPSLPFGGVNHSGIGTLGGAAGFREFSNTRGIVIDGPSSADRTVQTYPPFPAEAAAYLEQLLIPTT